VSRDHVLMQQAPGAPKTPLRPCSIPRLPAHAHQQWQERGAFAECQLCESKHRPARPFSHPRRITKLTCCNSSPFFFIIACWRRLLFFFQWSLSSPTATSAVKPCAAGSICQLPTCATAAADHTTAVEQVAAAVALVPAFTATATGTAPPHCLVPCRQNPPVRPRPQLSVHRGWQESLLIVYRPSI